MPTFEELGKSYASRIRTSMQRDGFLVKPRFSPVTFRSTETYSELRAIARDIDNLVMTDTKKPLSPEQRQTLYREIAEELGATTLLIESTIRCASNDDTSDLVDYIYDLLRRGK